MGPLLLASRVNANQPGQPLLLMLLPVDCEDYLKSMGSTVAGIRYEMLAFCSPGRLARQERRAQKNVRVLWSVLTFWGKWALQAASFE